MNDILGNDLFRCKGKTIKTILAGDPIGCNQSFVIEFTDGSKLEVKAYAVFSKDAEGRMEIEVSNG